MHSLLMGKMIFTPKSMRTSMRFITQGGKMLRVKSTISNPGLKMKRRIKSGKGSVRFKRGVTCTDGVKQRNFCGGYSRS